MIVVHPARAACITANNAEEYRILATQAREYREMRVMRASLVEQSETLLAGESIETLRKSVEKYPKNPQLMIADGHELKKRLDEVKRDLEDRKRTRHTLELTIAEQCAGTRSISDTTGICRSN